MTLRDRCTVLSMKVRSTNHRFVRQQAQYLHIFLYLYTTWRVDGLSWPHTNCHLLGVASHLLSLRCTILCKTHPTLIQHNQSSMHILCNTQPYISFFFRISIDPNIWQSWFSYVSWVDKGFSEWTLVTTLPETNIFAPENWWLEDEAVSFWKGLFFSGAIYVCFREGKQLSVCWKACKSREKNGPKK